MRGLKREKRSVSLQAERKGPRARCGRGDNASRDFGGEKVTHELGFAGFAVKSVLGCFFLSNGRIQAVEVITQVAAVANQEASFVAASNAMIFVHLKSGERGRQNVGSAQLLAKDLGINSRQT